MTVLSSARFSGSIDQNARVVLLVRVALLGLCTLLFVIPYVVAGLATREPQAALAALIGVAVVASLPTSVDRLRRIQPIAEAVLVAVVVSTGDPFLLALAPYLLLAPFAAGLAGGLVGAVTAVGLATIAAGTTSILVRKSTSPESFLTTVDQFVFTMLAVGVLTAWVRRIQRAGSGNAENESYAAAYRLISQLRVVSRQLSGGLDTVTLAQSLLQSLHADLGFTRAALLVRSPGGVLVPLAHEGGTAGEWDAGLSGPERLMSEAWTQEEPRQQAGGFDRSPGLWSAVLPLRIGVRTFGVVTLESDAGPFVDADLRAAMRHVEEAALRLETALLFSEVRSIATAEERRRVAREIHDGIAQELASLGYAVDDLRARTRSLPDVAEDLAGLRGELTRVISELRLSIFDLRSEVQPGAGLGAALSDHVRQVGAASPFRVHTVLDESPRRLPADTEAELLRIAQEAITNARKHARAENLWVTCVVDPPYARLRVQDDGVGLQGARDDSFGVEIMRERAERIGARLDVREGDGTGTVVEVVLDPAARVPASRTAGRRRQA